jgi:hypothetical protein
MNSRGRAHTARCNPAIFHIREVPTHRTPRDAEPPRGGYDVWGASHTGSVSAYGTFDQNGNVTELNETVFAESSHGARGGRWQTLSSSSLKRSDCFSDGNGEFKTLGFRVASIPEPVGMSFMLMSGITLLRRRRSAAERRHSHSESRMLT